VFSAHSDGSKNNEMKFYGDYNGDDTKISRENLLQNIKASDAFKNLDHVYLSSCSSLKEVDALKWMTDLPELNSCTGYNGKAGKSYYPMVQETIYNDLTQEGEFYSSLIDDDLEDKSKVAENYLEQIQQNWLGQMNISHSWKDENGNIIGTIHTINAKPKLCKIGFHYCKRLVDCFNYYNFNLMNKVAEIEILGEMDNEGGDKECSNSIKIIKEFLSLLSKRISLLFMTDIYIIFIIDI
jgi:hypothetical protein